jgi:hypothetical protein
MAESGSTPPLQRLDRNAPLVWATRFLKKNKIFFGTLAAVLLSFMALLVSVMQLVVGTAQTHLLKLQTEIARVQALPPIRCGNSSYLGLKGREVHQRGVGGDQSRGTREEVHVEEATSLDFTLTSKWQSEQVKKTLPLRDFFTATAVSSFGVDKVATLQGHINRQRLSDFDRILRSRADDLGWYCVDELKPYVEVAYKDMLGSSHQEYYNVQDVGGSYRIYDARGERLFEQLRQAAMQKDSLSLDTITPDSVVALLGIRARQPN